MNGDAASTVSCCCSSCYSLIVAFLFSPVPSIDAISAAAAAVYCCCCHPMVHHLICNTFLLSTTWLSLLLSPLVAFAVSVTTG